MTKDFVGTRIQEPSGTTIDKTSRRKPSSTKRSHQRQILMAKPSAAEFEGYNITPKDSLSALNSAQTKLLKQSAPEATGGLQDLKGTAFTVSLLVDLRLAEEAAPGRNRHCLQKLSEESATNSAQASSGDTEMAAVSPTDESANFNCISNATRSVTTSVNQESSHRLKSERATFEGAASARESQASDASSVAGSRKQQSSDSGAEPRFASATPEMEARQPLLSDVVPHSAVLARESEGQPSFEPTLTGKPATESTDRLNKVPHGTPEPLDMASPPTAVSCELPKSARPSKAKLLLRKARNLVASRVLLRMILGNQVGDQAKLGLEEAAKDGEPCPGNANEASLQVDPSIESEVSRSTEREQEEQMKEKEQQKEFERSLRKENEDDIKQKSLMDGKGSNKCRKCGKPMTRYNSNVAYSEAKRQDQEKPDLGPALDSCTLKAGTPCCSCAQETICLGAAAGATACCL